MENCKKCGTRKEIYYTGYCPKCDIQEIIKGKGDSYAIMPILSYGEKFVENFNKDKVWEQICEDDSVRNDVFIDYYLGDNEGDNMLRKVLDELNISYKGDTFFMWISW